MQTSHEWVLQTHGFHADIGKKTMRFDAVINFGEIPSKAVEILIKAVNEEYPDYTITISPDVDVSD